MPVRKGRYSDDSTTSIAAAVIIVLILIVGACAMIFGVHDDLFDATIGIANVMDYFHCPNCNTVVPCPYNHNGVGRDCPSCGLKMNIVSKNIPSTQNITDSNMNVTGGFGQGPGTGGYLVCPKCGTAVQHQRGVPAYSVNCPKCGTVMYRQLPAYIPTAFNNPTGNQNVQVITPPITSNAVMPHEYRGVCSKCHQITNFNSQSGYYQPGGYSNYSSQRPYRIGPGGSIIR